MNSVPRMVTATHEAAHQIFREDPDALLRAFRKLLPVDLPTSKTVHLIDTDLTEVKPIERRVDSLFQVDTEQGTFIIALESQGRDEGAKRSAWAYYLSWMHARYEAQPVLVVLCQDRATARWAARPIDFGLPGWPCLTLRPLVLGPDNVPVIADEKEAAADVPLAVFSAITHSKGPDAAAILEPLARALNNIDPDVGTVFAEFVEAGLGKNAPVQEQWRKLMETLTPLFRSKIAQEFAHKNREEGREEGIEVGREEGREEGIEVGRAEGREVGEAHGLASAIVRLLRHRGIDVPEHRAEQILTCHDLAQLERWWNRALEADIIEQLFPETA